MMSEGMLKLKIRIHLSSWLVFGILFLLEFLDARLQELKPTPLISIKHQRCVIKDTEGVCMFSWECKNSGGRSLGVCRDGILFGSCCTSPPLINPSASSFSTFLGHVFPERMEKNKYDCGRSTPNLDFESRVVNGVETKVGEFPWQASLRLVSPFPFTIGWCGAVVLNHEWVITAAHCIKGMKAENLLIRYGGHSLLKELEFSTPQERQPQEIFIHPYFTTLSQGHDIALIKVSSPVEFNEYTAPICLPGSGVGSLVGSKAYVTGWGAGGPEEDIKLYLQKAMVPILANEECEEMYDSEGKDIHVNFNFICAGYQDGGTDSCQGDSGGPLQVQGENQQWFLAGVTSSGFMCAKPNLPGLYTRISAYVPWILKHIST